jgi:hypothetical protein
MTDPNNLKMEDACRNLTSPLHQLVCGHFVAFDGYVNCRPNCKHVNAPYEYNTVQGSIFMICEACVIDDFSNSLLSQYDEQFDKLYGSLEFQQADVVQQDAMRKKLLDTSGATAHYLEFRRQRQMELFDHGGMISRWVPVDRFVDQMVTPLGATKIEAKGESIEDLFGSLTVTLEGKSTPNK